MSHRAREGFVAAGFIAEFGAGPPERHKQPRFRNRSRPAIAAGSHGSLENFEALFILELFQEARRAPYGGLDGALCARIGTGGFEGAHQHDGRDGRWAEDAEDVCRAPPS